MILVKLDCLEPNLQKMQPVHPSERRLKPVPRPALAWPGGRYNLRDVERYPTRAFKEMNGEPKSRYHV